MSSTIRFILDGNLQEVVPAAPTVTVLDYLRDTLRRTGSKEGCAEGDCGACTVVIGELTGDDQLQLRPVNACIQFLPTLDGKALFTVESLADGNTLHPAQQAMIDSHGSQCGFCTPGFVMSLFALYKNSPPPDRQTVDDALAGNLCRCTGYRPIIKAAQTMYEQATSAAPNWLHRPHGATPGAGEHALKEQLRALRRDRLLSLPQYHAPTSSDELAAVLTAQPTACLLAGGTDVGLWVTKQQRDLGTVVYLGNVADLKTVTETADYIEIGAAVTVADVQARLAAHWPDFGELIRRYASPPIRNAATLGGNIANGSPIGDSMPVLLALAATLVLRQGATRRELPLTAFYRGYRQTALQPGEFVERIRVPLPTPGEVLRVYKISKRFDQDISAVCAAFWLVLEQGRVRDVRIGYGGMAAIPQRAHHCEQTLRGQPWSEATVQAAMAALDQDFTPLSDMRASADYRQRVARNLLYKCFLESGGSTAATRVLDYGRPV